MSELSSVINFNRSVKYNLSQQSDMLEKLLIELWRAIEITGNIQSEAKGVDGSGFLHSVAKAERILVEAISELMQTAVIPVDGTSLQGAPSASQGVAPSPSSALPSPRG
jgi:hypothetical protein